MATFMDRHLWRTMPSATLRQLLADRRAGAVDARGAGPLGYWIEDAALYCLLRAPALEAAYQHHVDHQLASEGMHALTGVREALPLTADEHAAVVSFIQTTWH
jgi:hypothetical protein